MPPRLERFAEQMRRDPTRAELLLYNALLVAFEPYDVQVKSQERVSYYIADFMLYPARIVVEVDGGYHSTDKAKAYDLRRDSSMRALGIRIIRVTNARVFNDLASVIAEIVADCQPLALKRATQSSVKVTTCPPGYASWGKRRSNPVNLLAFNAKFRGR